MVFKSILCGVILVVLPVEGMAKLAAALYEVPAPKHGLIATKAMAKVIDEGTSRHCLVSLQVERTIRFAIPSVLLMRRSAFGLPLLEKESSQKSPLKNTQDQEFHHRFESFLFKIFAHEFGYTLIGAKPISLIELPRSTLDEFGMLCLHALQAMFRGSSNFFLKVLDWGPSHYVSLALINEQALKDLIKHNSIVQSYIRKEFQSEENFYTRLKDPQQGISRIVHDERILGYLLGYSKSNIEYYLRRIEVGTYLQKYPLYKFHPLPGGKYSKGRALCRNVSPCYKQLLPIQLLTG